MLLRNVDITFLLALKGLLDPASKLPDEQLHNGNDAECHGE